MSIEEEVFKRTKINKQNLVKYGFKNDNGNYYFSKLLDNQKFRADIIIDEKGQVSGKVFDLEMNEEYLNIKTSMNGAFVGALKEEYKSILKDIKDKCFETIPFLFDQSNRISKLIKSKYNVDPEFLWEKYPNFGVFRNSSSEKWFGIIMSIDEFKLTKKNHREIEIINVKLEPSKVEELLKEKGFYKAYHMNSKSWISISLMDDLNDNEIMNLIDDSYNATKAKK